MDPVLLSQALRCLKYLKNREWIDISSIDIWLMNVWEAIPQLEARYIPSAFIPPLSPIGNPTNVNDELDMFRSLFDDLPERGTRCPNETLVYVLNCGPGNRQSGNHFCVVVYSPSLGAVYLLGRKIKIKRNETAKESADWDSWLGREILSKMCLLMGWDVPQDVVLRTADWSQNGYDCGPIACQVAQHILLTGLRTEDSGSWKRPAMLRCCHPLRQMMAEQVYHRVMWGSERYGSLKTWYPGVLERRHGNCLEMMNRMHQELEEEVKKTSLSELHSVVRNLQHAIGECQICHQVAEEERHRLGALEHPIPQPKEDILQTRDRHRREALEGCRSANKYVTGAMISVDEDDIGGDDHDQDGQEFPGLEDPMVSVWPGYKAPVHVTRTNMKEARIGRFPRPTQPPKLPSRPHLRGLLLPFDRKFDEYEGGPTLEELPSNTGYNLQFQQPRMYVCNQVMLTPAPYSLFRDYGYRLMPWFAQSYDLGEPILVVEHLFPVGLTDPPKSITEYNPPNKMGRHGQAVTVNDVCVAGAEEILEVADEEGEDHILVTGRTKEKKYVCVDLLRDHVEPDILEFSCDIDSLIWITQMLKFQSPVAIYSAPVIRDRAPIWKNNHVQVEVLYPQKEEDKNAIGERDDWQLNRHSLSTIPHLLLGVLQGSSVAEILVFFPRMMHHDPHRHFRVTRIPKGIQELFWDRVVLPALKEIMPTTRGPYLPADRMHSAFKKGSGKQPSSISLDPKGLERLVRRMRKIVGRSLWNEWNECTHTAP